MKLKSGRCSTGHGTGALQEVPLRRRLALIRARRRHRLRILPGYRRGVHDDRGRSVPARKVAAFKRPSARGDLEKFWMDIKRLMPPRREDRERAEYVPGPSILGLIRRASSRKAAEKLTRAGTDASAGTRRKWARAIAAKFGAERVA
jgi:hypothetical protein